ncbi:hypothetical protein F0562_021033 [Nyssa sinensis]|uniref:non-specific serine/threonine protein kinase n=1 Tax=Nyssa sinensis TaxID=561372 RepID=A0A5J5BP27_9ASTE|nr:hypothetical protein F0562_021033 [Nyssa sinensis]
MSCFSCFSSHEKKTSKRINSGRKGLLPSAPAHNEPPTQPRPENQRKTPTEATNNKAANKEAGNNIAAQTFTFRELATATKNFRQECLVGEGGFGRVYKGKLDKTGQVVAVKQLDRNGLQGNREFLVEVLMLSLLHHQHLVNLIGYCADGDQRLLVYEYMPLGSLEDHLLDIPPEQKPLELGFKDENSFRVMGTYGYCAPEYQRTGQLTVKSDVYSFGVVLLELITGRRAIDTMRVIEEQNLVSWAQPLFKDPSRFPELADPLLRGDFPVKSLNQAVAVAAMCLQDDATSRPLMSDVVTALSYLWGGPEAGNRSSFSASASPFDDKMMGMTENHQDEINARERQQAVAEAIEWGSNSRAINGPSM